MEDLQALNGLTFKCQIKLPILLDTLRYQGTIPNDRLDDFNRCVNDAYSKADSGLRDALPRGLDPSVTAAVKKMYSTWRANMGGLTPFQAENPQTKRDLDQAIEALRVELMTR